MKIHHTRLLQNCTAIRNIYSYIVKIYQELFRLCKTQKKYYYLTDLGVQHLQQTILCLVSVMEIIEINTDILGNKNPPIIGYH